MKTMYRCAGMVLLGISLAHAHGVNIFAQTIHDSVVCECYYNDGKPVRDQDIQVKTLDGTVITEGTTDTDGMFSFAPDIHEDLKIVLNAGMGHLAETTVKKEDLPEIKEKRIVHAAQQPAPAVKHSKDPEQDRYDEERLRGIVEQVVDEKLRPVTELIHRQQRSYSLTTIIGGIGYIVGIFGLLMFWKSRKKR